MKRILLAAALVSLVVIGIVAAFVVSRVRADHNVRGSSTVEFVPTLAPEPPAPAEPTIAWPTYGYDNERIRVGPPTAVEPPFTQTWMFRARALVEFPPAIAYGRLYFANGIGRVLAVDAATGKQVWRRDTGRCQASSPAVDRHLVYVTFLRGCTKGRRGLTDGLLVAYESGGGAIRWQRRIGQSESSPLVHKGYVYVGDWTGRIYAFVARTGKLAWSFKTDGKIKSAVAVSGNRLFVGSYDSHVYALDLKTHKLVWKAGAQARLGHRGTFYSGPAVAYGRVYIGSTDGKVYSFGATSGKTRWARGTGGWVYSSPAVWRNRVYAGSYSRQFFCLDAATGDVKWQFDAPGKISGSPTIVNGIVYFATLSKRTFGLDALTGKVLFTFPDGAYTPVVADDERLYLVGEGRLYGLVPKVKAKRATPGRPRRAAGATGRQESSGPKPS